MKILLCLDRSRPAREAQQFLLQFPFAGQVDLFLAHVVEPVHWPAGPWSTMKRPRQADEIRHQLQDEAEGFLRQVETSFPLDRFTCHSLILEGVPGAEILEAIRKYRIDLAVVGSRGLSGLQRLALGSVSEWILTEAKSSVLIVRGSPSQKLKKGGIRKIVLATDGSPDAVAACRFVHDMELPSSSRVTLLHVVRKHLYQTGQLVTSTRTGTKEFAHLAEELLKARGRAGAVLLKEAMDLVERPGFVLGEQLAFGHEVDEILKAVRRTQADLVVLGSRGVTGLRRALLGSVSQRVARHAPCSVLVVRSATAKAR